MIQVRGFYECVRRAYRKNRGDVSGVFFCRTPVFTLHDRDETLFRACPQYVNDKSGSDYA